MLRETEEDAKNPFSVEERKAHIIQELAQEGYEHHKEYCIISVPNITHITYGRDVGYKIEQEHLGEEVESISATKVREQMKGYNPV